MDSLEKLQESFKDHSESDDRNFQAIRDEMRKGFETVNAGLKKMAEAQAPLTDAYKGTIFAKNFITGIAGVILAIAAFGGAIIWVVNASIQK